MKTCKTCCQSFPIERFYRSAAFVSGRESSCKTCRAKRIAAYRANRKKTPDGWAALIIPMVYNRAKRRGVPCSITAADLKVPDLCPILQVPFVFGDGSHPWAPSIDRRRPHLGYVPGNVFVISQRANRMKSDCTDAAAFRRLADWLDETE